MEEFLNRLGHPKVLVIGDIMLDKYIWGHASRISQEAPILVLKTEKTESRLGGAGSVATMLNALGAKVSISGIIGTDENSNNVLDLFKKLNIDQEGIIKDNIRPTTVKNRYIGKAQFKHPQQILRVDDEITDFIDYNIECKLSHYISKELESTDIVLISDYGKGVCTSNLVIQTINKAKERGIKVLIDPDVNTNSEKYKNCSLMTPNKIEAGLLLEKRIISREDIINSASRILNKFQLEVSIITLDKDGIIIAYKDGSSKIIPTRKRQVYDTTGAGDMVLSILGISLASSSDYETAVNLANIAGGLEVEKFGVTPITKEEILKDLFYKSHKTNINKVKTLSEILSELKNINKLGLKTAFTNGGFDIIHKGHVECLKFARNQADLLIVGLNSDDSIRRLKGENRPINNLEARINVLSELQSVDYIIVFDELNPIKLLKNIRPDVLVKGGDYNEKSVVGANIVKAYGGMVCLAPLQENYSTTGILKRSKNA